MIYKVFDQEFMLNEALHAAKVEDVTTWISSTYDKHSLVFAHGGKLWKVEYTILKGDTNPFPNKEYTAFQVEPITYIKYEPVTKKGKKKQNGTKIEERS